MKDIVNKFLIDGEILNICEEKNGLVNKTYLIETSKTKYLLQKINHYVFKKPDELMSNIELVTKHLKYKKKRTLEIVKTRNGMSYYYNGENYYRVYKYMSDLKTMVLTNDKVCLEVGKAIGNFQLELFDLNHELLNVTIPNFHNILTRFNALVTAYNSIDYSDLRKFNSNKCYNFIIMNIKKNMSIINAIKNGTIPLRITHNDTKLNNILFDKLTNKAICLIDLDTVMPGTILFDFADSCRTSIVSINEDSTDFDNIFLNDKKFIYLTVGYLSKIKDFLTVDELNLLVESIGTIVLECATRFLTDYLNYDVYFKTEYDEHNLNRCKNQLKVYEKYLEKEILYKKYLKIIYDRLNGNYIKVKEFEK